ncbi:hypothetical protein [Pseudomonas protegens]|uniref:DUF7832 domain-containing protein n=1 Tax=Pseudomonas protegens TaxID=380021 RepID=UPI000643698F|nr:hypothetical protein [Pseudomonas protegens]
MKYDEASWHYGGDFPADLPASAGAPHIGLFLAWMPIEGFAGEELADDAAQDITLVCSSALDGPALNGWPR